MQDLLTEIFKVKKSISATIMNEIFQLFENPVYQLRSGVDLPNRNSRTVFFGTESIMNIGAKLWNMDPENIKSSESFNVFKSKIKYWTPNHCPYRIYKIYIGQVGFINYMFRLLACLAYLFFNDKVLKILFKIIVKIFNSFVLKIYLFVVSYNDCAI